MNATRNGKLHTGGMMHFIKKRPSRLKYPSNRKHGNVPCAASDYCLSYIGRRRSLIDLLVDLAFDAAVPSTAMDKVCDQGGTVI